MVRPNSCRVFGEIRHPQGEYLDRVAPRRRRGPAAAQRRRDGGAPRRARSNPLVLQPKSKLPSTACASRTACSGTCPMQIELPPLGPRLTTITKPLVDATLDDVALAILDLHAQVDTDRGPALRPEAAARPGARRRCAWRHPDRRPAAAAREVLLMAAPVHRRPADHHRRSAPGRAARHQGRADRHRRHRQDQPAVDPGRGEDAVPQPRGRRARGPGLARRRGPDPRLGAGARPRLLDRRCRTPPCGRTSPTARSTSAASATASAIRRCSSKYETIFVELDHRRLAAVPAMVQGPAAGDLGPQRQVRPARRLRAARPGDDRLADPPAAHARQERLAGGHPRQAAGRLQPALLHAAGRGLQDRARAAGHRRRGRHDGRAQGRGRPASTAPSSARP